MKKQKRYLLIFTALCSLLLSGCGTQLYEMTKEEEDLIVQSAAYYVAKHNIQQKDGVSAVVDPDTITLEEENTEYVEENTESDTETEEVINPSEGDEQTGEDLAVSLAEVIGHENDLSVTYAGSYVANNYVEGAAYSVDADEGKTFYVMQFTIINTTDGEVAVDNVSLNPMFKLINDNVSVKSEVTFLTTDFSTYQGVIPAGESVKTILLFEVSESVAEEITAPTLQITIDNVTKIVKL